MKDGTTRYLLEVRDNDAHDQYVWDLVENIENPGSTTCAFLKEVNDLFNSEFRCSDAGFECEDENPCPERST